MKTTSDCRKFERLLNLLTFSRKITDLRNTAKQKKEESSQNSSKIPLSHSRQETYKTKFNLQFSILNLKTRKICER